MSREFNVVSFYGICYESRKLTLAALYHDMNIHLRIQAGNEKNT